MKYIEKYWDVLYICKLMSSLKTFICKKKKITVLTSQAKYICRLELACGLPICDTIF